VDFRALIFVDVLLVLAVTEIQLRSVPKADFVFDYRNKPGHDPRREHRAEPLGAFHVVLDQIVVNTPEQIDLKPRYHRAPHNRRDAH